MPDTTYLQFDLLIDRGAAGYRARVLNSPMGQAETAFDLPSLATLEATNPRALGQHLFEAVFAGGVGVSYRRSLDEARRQHAGLRVRLRLADALDLGAWASEAHAIPGDTLEDSPFSGDLPPREH